MATLESVSGELEVNGKANIEAGDIASDSDKLDGLDSTDFLRKTASNDYTNQLTFAADQTNNRVSFGYWYYNVPEEPDAVFIIYPTDADGTALWEREIRFNFDSLAWTIEGLATPLGSDINMTVDRSLVQGEIKQYVGKLTDLPTGWHICDGTKGTPDMTQDFKTYGTTDVVYIMYIGEE